MGYTLIQAKSVSYGGTRSLSTVKYIVIHYTGNNNDTAKANCNYFRYTNTRSAGAHYFVDRSGSVIQSIPLNRIAWSVGGFFTQKNGAGKLYKVATNTNSVSIELCDIASKYPSDAQINAVRTLVKHIQGQCKNAKTIIRHWDVNGKSCPARMTGTSNSEWARFKSAITSGISTSSGSTSSSNTSTGYKVKVIADTLNVRKGAGTSYGITTKVHKGEVYTIVAESNGWGKLKSGAGWISLSYTTKV